MKQIYSISGMTCNGCKAAVIKHLGVIPGVTSVDVDLENGTVQIAMNEAISLKSFQEVLPKKYRISQQIEHNLFDSNAGEQRSKLRQLQPLLLIFVYLITTAVLFNYKAWNLEETMLDFMGLFYIVFSFFKLLDLKGFPASFKMYDPLAKVLPVYGWLYPFIEITLGLAFLFRFEIKYALIATLIILGITTFGVTRALLNKKGIQCACLGTALKLPMTEATFIENAIMIGMAVWMLL